MPTGKFNGRVGDTRRGAAVVATTAPPWVAAAKRLMWGRGLCDSDAAHSSL